MEYRQFLSMTNEEVKQILTDMFRPSKVTCIKRNHAEGSISCKIYLEWETTDDSGKPIFKNIADEIILHNPFFDGDNAIEAPFSITRTDQHLFRQFCFAKGMVPWIQDNPYLH